MVKDLGKKLNIIRKHLHLTKEELAQGICPPSIISLLEKSNLFRLDPVIIEPLCQRLGIDSAFLNKDISFFRQMEEVNQVCERISYFVQERRYQEAYDCVLAVENKPMYQERTHIQKFMLWRKAISINYLFKDQLAALELLDLALEKSDTTSRNFSILDMNILNSKAIILNELGDVQLSYNLSQKVIFFIHEIPYQIHKETCIKIYYNSSRIAFKAGEMEEGLRLCQLGIDLCRREKISYLLGYLFFQKAECLKYVDPTNKPNYERYYLKAIQLFEKENNYQTVDRIREKMEA
ncbi:hypothetical protein [Alkalihalobacillus pseudalcaliphilus]|uniref:hypothetical protein n=1 Tax=Alkalihalobacillus pseudalcaliphilus TaxID=79884 RepID=UPI00064DFE1B|nr:hypothetical protein [Alkalihalobacillus pseudalcaliphilus]KMK75204.1 hypothetical protein AB990_17370 [Alkalihalobacillus pseudalcaliphilus]